MDESRQPQRYAEAVGKQQARSGRMKSSFMHERLSTLEKQMQGALDFVDDMTERDARNVRINCMYLRFVVV